MFNSRYLLVAERKYNDYLKSLDGKSINEYFNILFPIFNLSQISTTDFVFTISYIQVFNDLIKLLLPQDVITHIKQYIEYGFVCKYNIQFTEYTPFKPPKWNLIHHKSLNIKDKDFWLMLEKRHKTDYIHDWCPSISMEKDMLYFIERLIFNLHKINIDT